MRGLLQKDLCLLLQRSRVLFIFIGVGILIGCSTEDFFVIGYVTMLCAILTIGTISYDEFDNGYPFLLTLPITKKIYVIGKYVFCLLGDMVGWVIAIIIYVGCSIAKGNGITATELIETISFIPAFCLITAIMLPLQLKYGAEKSRLVIAIVAGGALALGYIGTKLLPANSQISAFLSEINDFTIMVGIWVIGLAALLISYMFSLHIMDKKEY